MAKVVRKTLKRRSAEVEEMLEEAPESDKPIEINPENFLSSGSTILNLVCTDNPWACYAKGKYHFIVGDSMSGKTWFSLSAFAEASLRPDFDNHLLIYDNVEDGASMDMAFYFGGKTAERVRAPKHTAEGEPIYSERVEDFYDSVQDLLDAGKPFIYILDSMDALTSETELKKVNEQRVARRKGKKADGSYGDGKAKINSANLRTIRRDLAKTDSILIIINQTRDNVGSFSFETKTRSGGHALRFYADTEMWFSVAGSIKKKIKDTLHPIGVKTLVKLKKNRFTGKLRRCEVPIYYSYGMDDISSCISFLVKAGHWQGSEATVKAPEFGFDTTVSTSKLIRKIENDELEEDLKDIVSAAWEELENKLKTARKRRYQ